VAVVVASNSDEWLSKQENMGEAALGSGDEGDVLDGASGAVVDVAAARSRSNMLIGARLLAVNGQCCVGSVLGANHDWNTVLS
jgi:hypothetical protein